MKLIKSTIKSMLCAMLVLSGNVQASFYPPDYLVDQAKEYCSYYGGFITIEFLDKEKDLHAFKVECKEKIEIVIINMKHI